jgi:hypothetical protein
MANQIDLVNHFDPRDPGATGLRSETMHARPDPAADDQAILINTPLYVDNLNYADVVRLAPEDEDGFRPILDVVEASGYAKVQTIGEFDIKEMSRLTARALWRPPPTDRG